MSGQSEVYTADRDTLFSKNSTPSPTKTQALSLGWVYGRNPALPVFSLQDHDQLVVFYAAANVGVIYNHSSGSQHILQGHSSAISSLCVSEDRRWVVTADSGPSPRLLIWDSYSGIPVCTLFDCHKEEGVSALAFSKDTKYLVTLGAGEVQHLCIWDWTNETEKPLCSTEINPNYGFQRHILFNPSNSSELLSCSETHVVLYSVDQDEESLSCTALKLRKVGVVDPGVPSSCLSVPAADGALVQAAFHWREPQILVATARGSIVLWDFSNAALGLKQVQFLPLQDAPFTVLSVTDSCVVTGDTQGQVKFYGYGFRLLAFYSDFTSDPVASISFPKECTGTLLTDSPLEKTQVLIRNFVVSTAGSSVFHVTAETKLPQTLLDEDPEPVHALCCHPSLPLVATGNNCGVLKVRDYNSKQTVGRRHFKTEKNITCVAFDPQGRYLAVGFSSGAVHLLNSVSLKSEPEEDFHFTRNSIQHLAFSSDSTYLASADSGNTVTVLRLQSDGALSPRWECLGRHRSHYKPIQELLFGLQLDSTQPRLLSLGSDRRLVEYDLENSGNSLLVLSSERVEQSAVPLCMTWYPPLTTEQFLLIASDQYKMKLINSTTNMCRKVVLGPTYGSPIQKVLVLPKSKDDKNRSYYMAYITEDKVGLQILPADGNPFKSSALICHPSGVSSLSCSFDGRFIFTSGERDCTVLSWDVSLSSLEAAAALGGAGMEPFYSLLDGGRGGRFFREIEDFFYYIQIRHQGTDSMERRQVSTRIPLTEVSTMMRAIGFFPTEQEIEDMQNEVKFSKYAETGKYVTDIDLEEFIKLYVNHRPAFGVPSRELLQAFTVLCDAETERPFLERQRLLQLLQAQGEAMTDDEVVQCFSSLLGLDEEQSERSTLKSSKSAIPEEISLETFVHQILLFPSASDQTSASN